MASYQSIFILSLIIFLTTIIGEFKRLEMQKEGFNIGKIFSGISKIFTAVGKIFTSVGKIFKLIFKDIPIWIGMVFKWLFFDIPKWSFFFVSCLVKKVISLPTCFLWYMLEVIGKIIYLPFQLTFWILDLMLINSGIKDIRIQKNVDKLWWLLDDIDHFQYEFTGFHIVHYPNDIIKKCYKCEGLGRFPSFPKFPGIKYKNFVFPPLFYEDKPPPKSNYLTSLLSGF